MDARSLALAEQFRSWHNDGLRYVLCDKDVDQFLATAPQSPQGQRSGPPPTEGRAWAKTSHASPRRQAPDEAPVRSSASVAEPKGGAQNTSDAAKEQKPPSSAPPTADDLAVFPWESFRPKLVVPARTVWTYWELGIDFGPNPMAERRELFRKIIHFLKWPAHSVAFWPLSFENRNALIANKGSFLRGVRETGAETLVCFGKKAFTVLYPRERYVHGVHELDGRTVIALPGPGSMLSGDAQAKRIVWDTLRSFRP